MLLLGTGSSAGVESMYVSVVKMIWILISSLKSKTKNFIKNSPIVSLTKLLKEPLKKPIDCFLKYTFAFYKVALRPTFGNACKFHPTCSCYSEEAFKKHGLFKGSFLTLTRILRCHPFSEGGLDPVPDSCEVCHG